MKRRLNIVMILMTLAVVITYSGCTSKTRIGDIQANPNQYSGKEVSIEGTVGDTFWLGVLGKGAYQIGDGTGTIWVVTQQPPPQKGMKISTRGTVTPLVKIGDRDLGTVIAETKRS